MYERRFINDMHFMLREAKRLGVCVYPTRIYNITDLIINHYSKGYYHNLSHIKDCLRKLKLINEYIETSEIGFLKIYFAIIFHDIIYDPTKIDNEINSAEYWRNTAAILQFSKEFTDDVKEMILATMHTSSSVKNKPLHYQYLIDIDLSILGAKKNKFEDYCNKIRQEYSFVPDSIFSISFF